MKARIASRVGSSPQLWFRFWTSRGNGEPILAATLALGGRLAALGFAAFSLVLRALLAAGLCLAGALPLGARLSRSARSSDRLLQRHVLRLYGAVGWWRSSWAWFTYGP